MAHSLHQRDNVTDICPALSALHARLLDAEAACHEALYSQERETRHAAEALAALHARHAAALEEMAGPACREGLRVRSERARGGGAAVLVGGVLPGALAALEDSVMRAFDRAITLDHSDPTRGHLEAMKAGLVATHEEIGLK